MTDCRRSVGERKCVFHQIRLFTFTDPPPLTPTTELKRLADEDARYMNVSLGFDTASLQPTYQLMWGAAGASNALDIARTLGFDG